MLSAAMAAILAMPAVYTAARADTDISTDNKSAQTTSSAGNITIESGGQVDLKASLPAVTINSNNSLSNLGGTISNVNTSNATGILVDTSQGNLVTATGIYSVGGLGLSGNGNGKAALAVIGGNTFFGPINFSEIAASTLVGSSTSTTTVSSSAISVQGDQSYVFFLLQGTTIDGNVGFGGPISLSTADTPMRARAGPRPRMAVLGAAKGCGRAARPSHSPP